MSATGPELDLDEIKRQIEAEASRLPTLEELDAAAAYGVALPEFVRLAPLRFEPPLRVEGRDEFHYKELARYADREFVRNAYLALLGHRPDPAGEKFYLDMLRRGRSKLEILVRLRYSAEGRSRGARLRGWFLPLAFEGVSRIPLVGYLVRVVIEVVLLPVRHRQNQTRAEMTREHLNAQSELIERKLNELTAALRELRELRVGTDKTTGGPPAPS